MAKEGPQDAGSKRPSISVLFGTPARNYLNHLAHQFKDSDVEGLAKQVATLLEDAKFGTMVERDVLALKARAVQNRYINKQNALTLKAKTHVGRFYPFSQGVPYYQEFAKGRLDEIVRGYSPK